MLRLPEAAAHIAPAATCRAAAPRVHPCSAAAWTRLNVGDVGAAPAGSLIHRPEEVESPAVETSDSSHSGIERQRDRRFVGLEGADAAKNGKLGWRGKPAKEAAAAAAASQSGFALEEEVGEDRGGVTGAELEMRRGGRLDGMEAEWWWPKFLSQGIRKEAVAEEREGLGKEEETGLA